MGLFVKIGLWLITILLILIALPFFPSIVSVFLVLAALAVVPLPAVANVRSRIFKGHRQAAQEEEQTRQRLETMVREMKAKNESGQTGQLKGIGKVRPNKYGNYLFVPEASFIVQGINPATGRKNKRTYDAADEADAINKAKAAGLEPPFDVEMLPAREPSEAQMTYAKNLGISIPEGACMVDVSALLTRTENDDVEEAEPAVLQFLAARGWRGSSLIGYNAMLETVNFVVEDPREQLALYAYYIYQVEHRYGLLNLDKDPRKHIYFDFADYALNNPKILEHYKRWRNDGSWSTAKTWGIYKDFKEYCGGKI